MCTMELMKKSEEPVRVCVGLNSTSACGFDGVAGPWHMQGGETIPIPTTQGKQDLRFTDINSLGIHRTLREGIELLPKSMKWEA